MSLFALALLAQVGATTLPLLTFPESGLDDSAAYQGYQTRFFRDAARNTVQIYLDQRQGRVVHLLADAENESIGFTARDGRGQPIALRWASAGADLSIAGRTRHFEYTLSADGPQVQIGLFLLNSMRVERDFQASGAHRSPFNGTPFELPEIARLLATLAQESPAVRRPHLTFLNASDLPTLRARLQPTVTTRRSGTDWIARIVQPTLDGRDTLTLELRADSRRVIAQRTGNAISFRPRAGDAITFAVRISTSGAPLTPLTRDEIFSAPFLDFAASVAAAGKDSAAASLRARRMERQMRGVELLSSHEKLMAGLPTYATYFGRDMMVTALMMRPIWREEMSAFVIGSVLRKLSPAGQVSHEEALGGQAVREAAAEYATLIATSKAAGRRGDRTAAESLLTRAGAVLRDHRRVRENYHMMDGEFQLPILIARWINDPAEPAQRKRAFLLDAADNGEPRLTRVLRELAFVARTTSSYAANPIASNLVSFAPRDSGRWSSASWRDSNAGYGAGRYAMDINAIWVPHALESIERIFTAIRALGFSTDSLARSLPNVLGETALGKYARDESALRGAIETWRAASQHFVVRLGRPDIQTRVAARLAAMPREERDHWTRVLATTGADQDSLTFLAIALDASGQPIGVANTDPATRLFLGDREGSDVPDAAARDAVLRDVRLVVRPYPVGLLIDGVGPVVANDAYAPPSVWRAFERDPYHGPRVAWGREVNLFLLGVTNRIAAAQLPVASGAQSSDATTGRYLDELRAAADRVVREVEASGFHSELWSYTFVDGHPTPVRYGAGADVQLWSTTDLAVRFARSRIK
ncbi:MAG: hypothetical protein ABI877_02280 [Gemmatimonadaceae bacterium]